MVLKRAIRRFHDPNTPSKSSMNLEGCNSSFHSLHRPCAYEANVGEKVLPITSVFMVTVPRFIKWTYHPPGRYEGGQVYVVGEQISRTCELSDATTIKDPFDSVGRSNILFAF